MDGWVGQGTHMQHYYIRLHCSWMWETCPRFLHGSDLAGNQTAYTQVRRSTSKPPSHLSSPAFDQVLSGSSGPDIAIFKRFQEHWPFVDRECFQPASTDPHVESLVTSSRSEVIEFALNQLQEMTTESSWNFRWYTLVKCPPEGFTFRLQVQCTEPGCSLKSYILWRYFLWTVQNVKPWRERNPWNSY